MTRERHEDFDLTASVILMPGETVQTSTMTILNEDPTGTVAIQPYNKDMPYDPIPGKYEGQVLHVNFHALASNKASVVITLKVPCNELSFWHYLHGSPSTKVTCISEDGSQSQQMLGDSNDLPLQVHFSGERISRLQISGISASEWFVIDHFEFS
ncbi:hypothetical protein ACIQAL_02205 [Pseudomonas sp. NPDC088368]|uniref:hypothetical protein n=1 Tax=Pseudomonas sp. NPDC088368 TaxID=3364453 RepID=UPI00380F5EDA